MANYLAIIHTPTHTLPSSSQQPPSSPPPPETTLLGVMGVSDWDFLRPPSDHAPSPEEEDSSKRPSLDDFDGEIAVFQVV